MTRRGKQFEEVVLETAMDKAVAAAARAHPSPQAGPSAKEVYKAACHAIADALAGDGFKYSSSQATLSRRSSDFRFWISFQSSHHNVSGQLVRLWIHAGVASEKLKEWRASHPSLLGAYDNIAGGQIGNLVTPHSWLAWNLAPPERRQQEIANAVAAIRKLAFPFFERFSDLSVARQQIASNELPTITILPASAMDFLMCFGTKEEATALGRRLVQANSKTRDQYRASLSQFLAAGMPRRSPGSPGDVLAAATLIFGLPDLDSATENEPTAWSWRYADDSGQGRPPSLSKAEQKARRAFAKSVGAALRSCAKGTGWKVSQGWLFRDDRGWFIDARTIISHVERKTSVELRAKPMEIDPIFWKIVKTDENVKESLSFRLFGAWTISTPPLTTVIVDEMGLDVSELAAAVVEAAKRALDVSRSSRDLEKLLGEIQRQHFSLPARPYLPAIVCLLILMERLGDARSACQVAHAAGEHGGFGVGSQSFTDLAIAWLDERAKGKHIA